MAVQQISRIQHRRGLLDDVPIPLNDAEFGWAEDVRELYIGEGPFFGGNTQILTQYTPASLPLYTYISNTGFDAVTGFDPFGDKFIPDPNFPIIRKYQQKFDDIVSVKDYGAFGDGSDDTAAILRAIFDIYDQTIGSSGLNKFRALYFPAGTYLTTRFIPLYPFCTLIGDGKTKTKILLDFTGPATSLNQAVARTVDSRGQEGTDIGADLGPGTPTFTPQNIVVRGISFESNTPQSPQVFGDKDIVRLDRAKNVRFEDCEFAGTWTSSDGSVGGSRAVVIENLDDSDNIPQNISFLSCNFKGTAFAFNVVEEARNIYVFNSRFERHRTAVKLGTDAAIDGSPPFEGVVDLFRVSHCRFGGNILETDLSILTSGFEVRTTGRGNISTYNVYPGIYTGDPGEAAVFFDSSTNACVSIGDTFPDMLSDVDCADKLINPRVQNASDPNENVVMNAQDLFQIPFGFCGNILIDGDLTVTGDILLGGSIISTTLPAFAPSGIGTEVVETIPYTNGNVIYYEYGMKDATTTPLTATYRVGTLTIIHNASYDGGGTLIGDPTVVDFADNFNELAGPFPDAPVTLTVVLGLDDVEISVNIGGGAITPTVVGVVRVQKV